MKRMTLAKASWYGKTPQKFDAHFMFRFMVLVSDRLKSVNTALQKKSLQFSHAELIVEAVK